MANFNITELSVCRECIQLLANGGCEGCETCVFSDDPESEPCQTVNDRFIAKWGADWSRVSARGDELGYSTSECDGCGTAVHGDRFTASALIPA